MSSPEAKRVWFVGQTLLTGSLNTTTQHRDYHLYVFIANLCNV